MKWKPSFILVIGSIITIFLIILWYYNLIGEPIAALGGAVLTLIGFLLSNDSKSSLELKDKKSNNIVQSHYGKGDNVGGDKIISK